MRKFLEGPEEAPVWWSAQPPNLGIAMFLLPLLLHPPQNHDPGRTNQSLPFCVVDGPVSQRRYKGSRQSQTIKREKAEENVQRKTERKLPGFPGSFLSFRLPFCLLKPAHGDATTLDQINQSYSEMGGRMDRQR